MKEALKRKVSKLEPKEKESNIKTLYPFSSYLKYENIILLGDPGSGKTYSFKAAKEEDADFFSVRSFLTKREDEGIKETVYLDGLDEYRSRIDDKNKIIEVIKLLNRLGCPRLRLSCRAADWLGGPDLDLFKDYFKDRPYVVLYLEPLDEEEVNKILRGNGIGNPDGFVRKQKIED